MAADPRTRTPLPLMRLMTAGLRSLDFCLKDCDGEGGRGGEGRMRGNRAIGQGTHRSRGRTQEKANENAQTRAIESLSIFGKMKCTNARTHDTCTHVLGLVIDDGI